MALIPCPVCQYTISDMARFCPGCGVVPFLSKQPRAHEMSNCLECKGELSKLAFACPNCGLTAVYALKGQPSNTAALVICAVVITLLTLGAFAFAFIQ